MIREMQATDWGRVSEIYLQDIESGISTFNTKCPDYETWDAGHTKSCRFVYEDGVKVVVGLPSARRRRSACIRGALK